MLERFFPVFFSVSSERRGAGIGCFQCIHLFLGGDLEVTSCACLPLFFHGASPIEPKSYNLITTQHTSEQKTARAREPKNRVLATIDTSLALPGGLQPREGFLQIPEEGLRTVTQTALKGALSKAWFGSREIIESIFRTAAELLSPTGS